MKTCKFIFPLAIIVIVFSNPAFSSLEGVSWVSYEEGVSQVPKEQKKLLIFFYTDWCNYCKEMDEKTFNDPAVASYINKNFIPVRVDSDKEQKTAKLFRVRGLPDTWFLSETQEVIGHRTGFFPAETMIQLLKYINSDSYKNMSLKSFIDNN